MYAGKWNRVQSKWLYLRVCAQAQRKTMEMLFACGMDLDTGPVATKHTCLTHCSHSFRRFVHNFLRSNMENSISTSTPTRFHCFRNTNCLQFCSDCASRAQSALSWVQVVYHHFNFNNSLLFVYLSYYILVEIISFCLFAVCFFLAAVSIFHRL